MRGKGTGRIRSSRQNRKRRVRIRRNGHESLSSLRIQNPVLGGRIASAESSGVDRVLQDWFPATIVAHWPTTSEHDRLLMHFDDGMRWTRLSDTLPDDTVRLTAVSYTHLTLPTTPYV